VAGRIPQGFIDEVVARSDIIEVIGARVALKKAGREYKACCPFHGEKTPSFTVSPTKQFFHCFGCGAHGTVLGFLMDYEKLGFLEALTELAERAGLELPREAAEGAKEAGGADLYELMGRAARFFEQNLKDSTAARSYLEQRGVDEATGARFGVGYAPDSWNALLNRFGTSDGERRRLLQVGLIIEREARAGEARAGEARAGEARSERDARSSRGYYDRFRDRIMFPIRDARGRVLAFGGRIIGAGEPKYLNSPETPLFHKGRELYGLFEARKAHADFKRLLIVEGYMDVVRLHQHGITYAVATLGTATTQEHLNKLFRLTSEVVFCFDGDRAGRQAAWRALENALSLARDGREFRFLFLPEGHDPDSLVGAEGRAAFEARLKDAEPLSEYLVRELSAQVDLEHVDGRARLAALAGPLFARMPDGVYRELLADRLAAQIRMPAAKLKEHLIGAQRTGTERPAPPRRAEPTHRPGSRISAGRGTLLTQAISCVLHHPKAAQAVSDSSSLEVVDKPGAAVLRELIEVARSLAQPSTALLLERFRDRPEHARLTELAMADPMVDEAAAGRELAMAVAKLVEAHGPQRRLDELLRKAEELGLNFEEKTELKVLLDGRAHAAARRGS
jgi:DNA primase